LKIHKLKKEKIVIDDLPGRNALIKASGLKRGRILDIGMGDCGCMSFFLAKRGFNVIGIDYDPKAIYKARKTVKREKFSGTFEAKLCRAEDLPFPNNTFDGVVAYHSFHHMHKIEKVIREMKRVCKENGYILISDLNEKGRKTYKHKPDKGKLLKRIEKYLRKYTFLIRKIKTKYDMLFICRPAVVGDKKGVKYVD
jgi:ubiquinone/menaquinone biosynthesis C-methylase UbiE